MIWRGAEILQGVSASWMSDVALRKTTLLLRRYPKLQAFWAANDVMALAALRALEEAGRRPGVFQRLVTQHLASMADYTRQGAEGREPRRAR